MDENRETFLKTFFSSKFEMVYNKAVINGLNDNQVDPILSYIKEIIAIPIKEYIEYLVVNPSKSLITPFNYTQISKIELCHTEMCKAFKTANYKGLTTKEIGILLHNGQSKEGAHSTTESKYGENVKGASQLGLTISKDGRWYLSYFGYVYTSLEDQQKTALISRVLLRDPFYAHYLEKQHIEMLLSGMKWLI